MFVICYVLYVIVYLFVCLALIHLHISLYKLSILFICFFLVVIHIFISLTYITNNILSICLFLCGTDILI